MSRPRLRQSSDPIEALEARVLLTVYNVEFVADTARAARGEMDGVVSLREAVEASRTNQAFGDAPAGTANDIINLPNGRLELTAGLGPMRLGEDVRMRGAGLDATTIDGNGGDIFVRSGGGRLQFRNFTMENGGRALDYAGGATGGLVRLDRIGVRGFDRMAVRSVGAGHRTILEESLFADNVRTGGGAAGAVEARGAKLTIDNTEFRGNVGQSVGAVNALTFSLAIRRGTFVDNATSDANASGGGVATNAESIFIADSVFEGNGRTLGGGLAIFQDSARSGRQEATITGTMFERNSARSGGAVAITGDRAAIVTFTGGTTIDDNRAAQAGGGVYVRNGAARVQFLSGTKVTDNQATTDGGGIDMLGGRIDARSGAEFLSNSARPRGGAGGAGGAINLVDGDLRVNDATFRGNGATRGGALALENVAGLVKSATFDLNEVVDSGGGNGGGAIAIAGADSSVTLDDTTLSNNYADGFGGAVAIAGGGTVLLRGGSVVAGNETLRSGGGLAALGSRAIVRASEIRGNRAARDGGGVSVTAGGGAGGAGGSAGRLTMSGSQVVGNRGRSGGGVFLEDAIGYVSASEIGRDGEGNVALRDGAGLAVSGDSSVTVLNTVVSHNATSEQAVFLDAVKNGGGVSVVQAAGERTVLRFRSNVRVDENTAIADGGGVYVETAGDQAIPVFAQRGGRISGNVAGVDGGGLFLSGGVDPTTGQAVLLTVQVTNNEAVSQGGGVYSDGSLRGQSLAVRLNKSSTADGGGGFYLAAGHVTADDSGNNTVEDNLDGNDVEDNFSGPGLRGAL